jgi:hypothetical protein
MAVPSNSWLMLPGRGADQQAATGQQHHHQNQPSPLQHVAQRHNQQQAQGIAQLRRGDDAAGTGGADAQFAADFRQQGLGVIITGHGQAGGYRHQPHQQRAEPAMFMAGGGGCGWCACVGFRCGCAGCCRR